MQFQRSNYVQRASKVVKAAEGDPAYLHCTVPHSDNNLVSAWERVPSFAPLTLDPSRSDRLEFSPEIHGKPGTETRFLACKFPFRTMRLVSDNGPEFRPRFHSAAPLGRAPKSD